MFPWNALLYPRHSRPIAIPYLYSGLCLTLSLKYSAFQCSLAVTEVLN